MEDSYITAIGKGLGDYDALDTGVFVCSPYLFNALDAAIRSGDTTLSGGIRSTRGEAIDAGRGCGRRLVARHRHTGGSHDG